MNRGLDILRARKIQRKAKRNEKTHEILHNHDPGSRYSSIFRGTEVSRVGRDDYSK